MNTTVHAAGVLRDDELKRLIDQNKQTTIGPVTVYYGGVTAPVITAGMALVTRTVFEQSGFSDYWSLLLSTLMSALAGVSWYLIFMRWSKREIGGRAGENQLETQIASSNEGLIVRRGAVETSAPWSEVKLKRENRDALILSIAGAGTVLVPRRWAEAGRDFDTLVDRLKSQGANNA